MRNLKFALTFITTLCGGLAAADPLPLPQGEVVLTVSGSLKQTNRDDTVVIDFEALSAMPATTYETTTIWTEGKKTFVGVALAELLDQVGDDTRLIKARAINDYTVEIPADSVTATAPIVAYTMDGAAMSRRQKGPLWIVYPYDSDAAFRTEVVYSRSIWQLDRLELVK